MSQVSVSTFIKMQKSESQFTTISQERTLVSVFYKAGRPTSHHQ